MASIREVLIELNPWWKEPPRLDYKEREVYAEVQRFMRRPQIVALTGLRRVGKTTLMLKLAEDAMAKGLDPRDIVYFSFDEFKHADIRAVLKEYEAVLGRELGKRKNLILLDEIQKLEGWEDQLKAIYDARRGHVKVVISGSESLFIRTKSRETLAGRIFEFKVEPLSFREYLAFKDVSYEPIGLHGKELARLFDEFTRTLGFPELVGERDKAVIRKYVRESIVDRIVYRDLPGVLKIRDIALMEQLLGIIMEEPGQIIEVSALSRELGASRQTVSTYLSHLEKSFLVRKLYNYSTGRRKVERKLKKYYPTVVSVDLLFREDDQARSRVFEWLVVNQLKAEYFWRDPYKNEVDIVLVNGKPVPIEVKFGNVDSSGLLAFMRKFKVDKGHIIHPDRDESHTHDGKTISIVPAYRFLLAAGKAAE